MATLADVERQPTITGGLAELHRRLAMERGDLAPPPGTTREQRQFTIMLAGRSINEVALKSRSFDRLKVDLQGRCMRELDAFKFLLPRPIPSVGHDGEHAPIWIHVRLRFRTHGTRDDENLRTLAAKAVCDALVGPLWRGQPVKGQKRQPAHRRLWYGGRLYVGGWLHDDGHRHKILTLDFDEERGPASITVTLVWNQPA